MKRRALPEVVQKALDANAGPDMKGRARPSSVDLLAWLQEQRDEFLASYREADGYVRHPNGLHALRMIDALDQVVKATRDSLLVLNQAVRP